MSSQAVATAAAHRTIRTKVPFRLDRLPWSRFHWRIVIGLGTVWILDGLEVTIVGTVAARLTSHGSGISISSGQVGLAGGAYVAGACLGALIFGYLTDRFGRKRLFMITLGIYIVCTAATGLSFTWWYFMIFRFLTGMGIGGEYASINSAIDELIPARARGTIDLSINGSYWAGSIAGSALALVLLDEALLPADVGWRLAFGMGVVLGLFVLLVRRNVPESPRWLFLHGREEEAERLLDAIEKEVTEQTGAELAPVRRSIEVEPRERTPLSEIAATATHRYPKRAVLALALFVGQAFIYNGITFNIGTLLGTFFGVASGAVPLFTIVYGASNLAGPLSIGRLFDTIGRRPMISGTYIGSAGLGALLAVLFLSKGSLNAWTFMALLLATFFLASAGASAAYLTASEIFPMEMRALAIALFYAIGTALGGILGPLLFAGFIASGNRHLVALAFFIGAGVMAIGGIAELFFGVKAERAELEDIAAPMTAVDGQSAKAAATANRTEALAARQRAAEQRARAAEHRAVAHELAAAPASERNRIEDEHLLAAVADELAMAQDEQAAAADAGASPSARPDEPDAELPARAAAALERSRSHDERARALAAADAAAASRHRALAEAALARARRHEHVALAEQAEGRVEEAEPAEREPHEAAAALHRAWGDAYGARAMAHEAGASGDAAGERAGLEEAERLEAVARAKSCRAEAATQRAEARRALGEAERAEASRRLAAEIAEQRLAEAQLRERIAARRRAETSGLRRYRPGPAERGALRSFAFPAPEPEAALDEQVRAIARTLAEHGPLERRELARLVGAGAWGPGAFARALRQAILEQSARRLPGARVGPGDAGPTGVR
ncbi:MAG: MFS transporter [Actinomycetota bacterium]|nr:MFS transporter [Actinomycetota bacterium]